MRIDNKSMSQNIVDIQYDFEQSKRFTLLNVILYSFPLFSCRR